LIGGDDAAADFVSADVEEVKAGIEVGEGEEDELGVGRGAGVCD